MLRSEKLSLEEAVGFQPTRRDDYRPNGFQVRPLQALGYTSNYFRSFNSIIVNSSGGIASYVYTNSSSL